MAKLIYDDDLFKKILESDTPVKAKRLADNIRNECSQWREMYFTNGAEEGKNKLRVELKKPLNFKEGEV